MFREDADDHVVGGESLTSAHFGADDIGWQALGPAIACVTASTCVVALRWYTRCRIVRCLGWDDYVILLSLLLAWAMLALVATAVQLGIGATHISPMETATLTKLIIANNDLWALLVNITKASILAQYLRIFSGPRTRALCYSLLATLLPAAAWAVLGGTLLCSPAAKLWEPWVPGHCISAQRYWLSVACTDIGLDFLVLLLPLPAITALHLPRGQQFSLILVFALGFVVCGVSIARLCTVLLASEEGAYVESGIWAIIWSAVEANVGIICACLLALKPLIGRLWPGSSLVADGGSSEGCVVVPPRYSMRLPDLRTTGVPVGWPSEGGSNATTLVSPTTPTSRLKSEVALKRPSLALSLPVMREVEDMAPTRMPLALACTSAMGC
ncbi:hypothetical protein LTR59_000971 [Friedmanniomyces endolithicus]|nr:hypothetical protein LTR94_003125 [Friedmanniomyces endolithicus]KAK0813816.1 hypothetical protein LTR59_000971 [Friedmanniomyces endolithicus]KAK0814750.1 hypothetical protein LTR38_002580 [Friedmanniomyces endolithicus]